MIDLADRIYRVKNRSGERAGAYLLTNDERFLLPYREGREQGRKMEDQLRQLLADKNPDQTSSQ